jgi:hypothetical protein
MQISALLSFLIVPLLILTTLLDLAAEVAFAYFLSDMVTTTYNAISGLERASAFINCFMNMAVFVGVAVVAMQRPSGGVVLKNSIDRETGGGGVTYEVEGHSS